jgi:hypothetical protein
MNNLYHKVAVASICTALSFTLVTNKEAKAATFNLTPTSEFSISTDFYKGNDGIQLPGIYGFLTVTKKEYETTRAFYEFNLLNLFPDTNTVVKQATLRTSLNYALKGSDIGLGLYSYLGNGTPDKSDFYKSDFSGSNPFFKKYFGDYDGGNNKVSFDVTLAIRDFRIDHEYYPNESSFIGFNIYSFYSYSEVHLGSTSLEIVTEPVPEPTTIFGSALALSLGGWLKRKKSSQQNKTTLQH